MEFFQWIRKQLSSDKAPLPKTTLYIPELIACENPRCHDRAKKHHSVSYTCGGCWKNFCSSCILIGEGTGTISCPCCKVVFALPAVLCHVREVSNK